MCPARMSFFLRLQETIGRVARGDLLIVVGDINTRVGNNTGIWGEVFGRHGEEVCSEDGSAAIFNLLELSPHKGHETRIGMTWLHEDQNDLGNPLSISHVRTSGYKQKPWCINLNLTTICIGELLALY